MLVVLGGSSPWTVELIERLEPEKALLVGQNGDALTALRRFLRGRCTTAVDISTDPVAALGEASVVLCQARIGGWRGRREDEATPPTWGGYGDETLGVGGLRAAIRASKTLSRWARAAPSAPTVMLSNPTDLLTRWWQLHSDVPAISVCEAPTELINDLPEGTTYLGVNHLGWALTPDGQRIPTRWLPIAGELQRRVRRQRARSAHRADELLTLSRALNRAIATADHEQFDALINRRIPRWYDSIVVPVLRGLLEGEPFFGVVGLPNAGRLPSLPAEMIVESPTTLDGNGDAPVELIKDVTALAESRQLAWEVLIEPTRKRLLQYTEADPFSTGAKYPPDLLSWIMGE